MNNIIKTNKYRLYLGDCLEIMPKIKQNSVDLIIADLPYGTTSCKWDSIIPLNELWEQYSRLIRNEHTPIILFANIHFALELISSKRDWFKYEWIWQKSRSGSAICAKYMPNRIHEYILVFAKGSTNYCPIMTKGDPYKRKITQRVGENNHKLGVKHNGGIINEGFRYPVTIQHFKQNWSRQQQVHPTQKPVELLEYLIKTYSKSKDIVLDNTMGSGTTGIACINTGRRFIGIEREEKYFNVAFKLIKATQIPLLGNIN